MSKRKNPQTKYPVVEVRPPRNLMLEHLRALFEESKAQLDFTENPSIFDPLINVVGTDKKGETVLLYELYMYPEPEEDQPVEETLTIEKENSPPTPAEDIPKEPEAIFTEESEQERCWLL